MRFQSIRALVPLLVAAGGLLCGCPPTTRNIALTSYSSGAAGRPMMIGTGGESGTLYLAYSGPVGAQRRMLFRKSTMRGPSFSAPLDLGPCSNSEPPALVAGTGGRVYLAWQANSPPSDIFFAVSNDSGGSFVAPQNLSNNTTPAASLFPEIASSGSNVYVAWFTTAASPATQQVFVSVSSDYGQTWTTKMLSSTAGGTVLPRVAASGNHAYVIWNEQNHQMRLATSSDAGATFSSQTLGSYSGWCRTWQVLANGSSVYALWSGGSGRSSSHLHLRASNDDGATFGPTGTLTTGTSEASNARMAKIGTLLHVVWQSDLDGDDDIYYVHTNESGVPTTGVQNLSDGHFNQESSWPSLGAWSSYAHVAWQDAGVGNYDIFYRRSGDGGQTFATYQILPPGPSDPSGDIAPIVVARAADRYIVYVRGDGTASNIRFYCWRKWRAGG